MKEMGKEMGMEMGMGMGMGIGAILWVLRVGFLGRCG